MLIIHIGLQDSATTNFRMVATIHSRSMQYQITGHLTLSTKSVSPRRIIMKKLTGTFITLGTALLIMVGGLMFRVVQAKSTSPFGPRPVQIWLIQSEQSFAQTLDGVFGANAVLVTPNEIIVLYEMQSQSPGNFEVESAFFNTQGVMGNEASNFMKVDNIQTLGEFERTIIGAVHIKRADQPNQILSLRVTLDRSQNQPWQISPLEQLELDPGRQGITFLPIYSPLAEFKVEAGRLGGENNYAILRLSPSNTTNISPIFLQVDRQSVISQITELEFNTLTSPVISPDAQNPMMATPAPPEKP
jgi:hypothetical protein